MLLKVIFGVKCNSNPKRVSKYEFLAFETKKFLKGVSKKFFRKNLKFFFTTLNDVKTHFRTFLRSDNFFVWA